MLLTSQRQYKYDAPAFLTCAPIAEVNVEFKGLLPNANTLQVVDMVGAEKKKRNVTRYFTPGCESRNAKMARKRARAKVKAQVRASREDALQREYLEMKKRYELEMKLTELTGLLAQKIILDTAIQELEHDLLFLRGNDMYENELSDCSENSESD